MGLVFTEWSNVCIQKCTSKFTWVHFSSSCFSINTQLGNQFEVAPLFSLLQGLPVIDSNQSSHLTQINFNELNLYF